MPTIATMFNSRLPPHSIAGNTTKTVHVAYCFFGFPTNGQAKELPSAAWDRLWLNVPGDKLLSANTRPGYPCNR